MLEVKIKKIINGELSDLTEEAYKVALDRRLEVIGKKLKDVYLEVLDD